MKMFPAAFRAVLASALFLAAAAASSALAQNAGNVDPGFDPGIGPSYPVNALAVQSDGKIIIGGSFYYLGTYTVDGFARLNADGTIDFTFNPHNGANGRILSVALQADGKVLLGGDFTEVNGYTRYGIARLNTDGSVDETFGNYAGANGTVRSVVVQPDGQILVGGDFTSFNNNDYNYIARLNGTDGSLDFDFDPGYGASSSVIAIALQADNSILIGGNFLDFDGYYTPGLVRVDTTGGVDTTFGGSDAPTTNNYVAALLVQPDGKIVVGGGFTEIGGYFVNAVARLDTDGGVDTAFYDPAGGANGPVLALGIQPNGDIIIGGDFTGVDYIDGGSIARLLPNGVLDTTYGPGFPANGAVNAVRVLPDGETIAGGAFTSIGGITRDFIARLYNGATANPTNVRYIRLLSLNGLNFNENSNLILSAEANSPDDPIVSLTLYNNGAQIGKNALSAAEIEAVHAHAKTRKEGKVRQDAGFDQGFDNFTTLISAGLNNISVTGTTQSGATVTSNTSAVMGQSAATPTAACVITSPAAGTLPAAGTAVQVSVTTSADSVTVDFYVDSAKSGSSQVLTDGATVATFVLPALATDRTHTLSAVVTDNGTGVSAQSDPVILTPATVVMPMVPTVSIEAPDGGSVAATSGEGPAVKLHIVRSAADGNAADLDVSQPLTVSYKAKGSAQAGVNYKVLSGSVTIPAGATSVKLKIKPLDDGLGDLTVLKVKVLPSADGSYNPGGVTLAKVKISG